jgi:hypothetical protein
MQILQCHSNLSGYGPQQQHILRSFMDLLLNLVRLRGRVMTKADPLAALRLLDEYLRDLTTKRGTSIDSVKISVCFVIVADFLHA